MIEHGKLDHGIDSASYRVSEHIRLEFNEFFRSLLRNVRGGQAFLPGERVLDIGCGDETYFLKLWNHLGDVEVVGIDKANLTDCHQASNVLGRKLIKVDFFNFDTDMRFDVVYSSFVHSWLLAPRANQSSEQHFFQKLHPLLNPGGWYAAHYVGAEDYFPYYTNLLTTCLSRMNDPLGNRESYLAYRRTQLTAPSSLKRIRNRWKAEGYETCFLAKTLEWIPLRRNVEFLAYWESGGRRWIEGYFSREFPDEIDRYQRFKSELQLLIEDDDRLASLGVRTFTDDAVEYILLPAFHLYHIAQKSTDVVPPAIVDHDSEAGLSDEWQKLPIRAQALARKMAGASQYEEENGIKDIKSWLNRLLRPHDKSIAYIATISALKDRNMKIFEFGEVFETRREWVQTGARLSLPTFTDAIFHYRLSSRDSDAAIPVAIVAHVREINDRSLVEITRFEASNDIPEVCRLIFLWPANTLEVLTPPTLLNASPHDLHAYVGVGSIFATPDVSWARLLMFDDETVNVVNELSKIMPYGDADADFVQPFRYFDWHTRVTGPDPQDLYVCTSFADREESAGRTVFLCVAGNKESSSLHSSIDFPVVSTLLGYSAIEIARAHDEAGKIYERTYFAHQVSPLIRYLLTETSRWSEAVLQDVSDYFVPTLAILDVTLKSFRGSASSLAGPFPWVWSDTDNPIDTYLDIALAFAVARAIEAPPEEKCVRESACYYIDQPDNKWKELKGRLCCIDSGAAVGSKWLEEVFKDIRVATIVLLILKQALYHTFRAACHDANSQKMVIQLSRKDDRLAQDPTVTLMATNPAPNQNRHSPRLHSKDQDELQQIAKLLSTNSGLSFTVEGPSRIANQESLWFTSVSIFGGVK